MFDKTAYSSSAGISTYTIYNIKAIQVKQNRKIPLSSVRLCSDVLRCAHPGREMQ